MSYAIRTNTLHTAVATTAIALALGVSACGDARSPLAPAGMSTSAATANSDRSLERGVGARAPELGTTLGWGEGKTVEFFYTKPFFCAQPPHSGATTQCEAGEDGTVDPIPNTTFPTLYVMTPMGFTPPPGTLHCPVVGNCVAHPSTIDLSRIMGPGFGNAPLPAHSHVIDTIGDVPGQNEDEAEFWEIEVIGVKSLNAWNKIALDKKLTTVRRLQKEHRDVTDDIGTNTYLFFGVRPLRNTTVHIMAGH